MPEFRETANFAEVLRRPNAMVVADPSGEGWPQALSKLAAPEVLNIAIGPEGGLSAGELAAARAAGASVVSLGANILRAETAAVVAAALVRASLPRRAQQ